jgi:hypothetical protein
VRYIPGHDRMLPEIASYLNLPFAYTPAVFYFLLSGWVSAH